MSVVYDRRLDFNLFLVLSSRKATDDESRTIKHMSTIFSKFQLQQNNNIAFGFVVYLRGTTRR